MTSLRMDFAGRSFLAPAISEELYVLLALLLLDFFWFLERMICESTNVFVDYLFGGEYFVNKLYIFVISMLLCIFWYQNIFNCLIRASPRSEELPPLMKFLTCWYKYLLIICSEVKFNVEVRKFNILWGEAGALIDAFASSDHTCF